MSRLTHDGELLERLVDHGYVVHHRDAKPGLLVVTRVPALVCDVCDEPIDRADQPSLKPLANCSSSPSIRPRGSPEPA
jgi:hypothetical protein